MHTKSKEKKPQATVESNNLQTLGSGVVQEMV